MSKYLFTSGNFRSGKHQLEVAIRQENDKHWNAIKQEDIKAGFDVEIKTKLDNSNT